jgi:hypothetical protein
MAPSVQVLEAPHLVLATLASFRVDCGSSPSKLLLNTDKTPIAYKHNESLSYPHKLVVTQNASQGCQF